MSHYTVTVCLSSETINTVAAGIVGKEERIQKVLAHVLAPFDESISVDPYRVYEEGSSAEYWWVTFVRKGAEEHRTNAPVEPKGTFPGDGKAWRNGHGLVTIAENERLEREERQACVEWADRLGDNPTWELVVSLYNERYYPNTAVAVPSQEPDDGVDTERIHVDEEGRAYSLSTYNPLSKWDYWRIGGRWRNRFQSTVRVTNEGPHWENGQLLIRSSEAWDGPKGGDLSPDGFILCDGGPVGLLNFAAMRDAAEARANRDYDQWESLVAEHGHPEPWERLRSLAELGEITWDIARHRYNSQRIVEVARKQGLTGLLGPSVEARFGTSREEYVRTQRDAAVPGYAMLTLTGEWVAPGKMGWFGMSSDGPGEADTYNVQANKYLDSLKADDWLVQIDCHI